jgi:hypothetical protein
MFMRAGYREGGNVLVRLPRGGKQALQCNVCATPPFAARRLGRAAVQDLTPRTTLFKGQHNCWSADSVSRETAASRHPCERRARRPHIEVTKMCLGRGPLVPMMWT